MLLFPRCPQSQANNVLLSPRSAAPPLPSPLTSPPTGSAPLPFFFVVGAVIEEFPFLVNVPADGIARPDGDNVFQTAQRLPSQEQFFTWRSDGAGSMCGGEAVAFPPAPAPLLLLLRLLLYQAARRQSAPFAFPTQASFPPLPHSLSPNKAPPLSLTGAQTLHAASA